MIFNIQIEAQTLDEVLAMLRQDTAPAQITFAPPAPAPAVQAPPATTAPTVQAPPTTTAVPVATAPAYSQEQIMAAGATLIDAGKMTELMDLLAAFGVQAVTQLAPEQLGAFATELRKLGAQL